MKKISKIHGRVISRKKQKGFFILPFGSGGSSSYQIANSLRFRSSASAYLSRTFGTPTSNTTWSYSLWLKRGQIGAVAHSLLSAGDSEIYFRNATTVDSISLYKDGANVANSSAVFRDPTGHMHLFFVSNGTTIKAYRNNEEVLSYTGTIGDINFGTYVHTIGKYAGGASDYLDGVISDVHFIDGQALTPSSFGEQNSDGVWGPKRYTGTYGNNGFYLPFNEGTSATTLCYDRSGNGNNWTPNGISTASGVTYDWLTDTPTNNYATLNPLLAQTASSSNLVAANLEQNTTLTGGEVYALSTTPLPSTGKFYAEFSIVAASGVNTATTEVGLVSAPRTSGNNSGRLDQCPSSTVYRADGNRQIDGGTATAYGATWGNGDTIGVAVDMDAASVTFYKNNTSQGAITSLDTQDVFLGVCLRVAGGTGYAYANFGQRPFAYTPPTGFKALCTANMPSVAITNPSLHHTVKTDTGANIKTTAEAQYASFLEWIKDRANSNNHQLIDSVRGTSAVLQSNTTAAETTYSAPSGSSVAWIWKANGAGVSNTDGSITSTVSANTTAGFSIVTYTGNGVQSTVGHGLGKTPSLIILKSRSGVATSWAIYHASVGATKVLQFDTNAAITDSTSWADASPTSSVFYVGTAGAVNQNTGTFVAYCFAEIAGFSKFGSYTGNGSADGPFVYCGFRPRWLLLKSASGTTGDWILLDLARDTYNATVNRLLANTSDFEAALSGGVDVTANGFKIRSSNLGYNGTGNTYIFAAFAELPFGGSNVAPAPAR